MRGETVVLRCGCHTRIESTKEEIEMAVAYGGTIKVTVLIPCVDHPQTRKIGPEPGRPAI